MTFIHDSEFGYHGNLKSSKCLVDSRWVLKINDFGVGALMAQDVPEPSLQGDEYCAGEHPVPDLSSALILFLFLSSSLVLPSCLVLSAFSFLTFFQNHFSLPFSFSPSPTHSHIFISLDIYLETL